MLDPVMLEKKMNRRGFVISETIGGLFVGVQKMKFVSKDTEAYAGVNHHHPVMTITIDLEKDEFMCEFNLTDTLKLSTPSYWFVMDNHHFNQVFHEFEKQVNDIVFHGMMTEKEEIEN